MLKAIDTLMLFEPNHRMLVKAGVDNLLVCSAFPALFFVAFLPVEVVRWLSAYESVSVSLIGFRKKMITRMLSMTDKGGVRAM